MVWSRLILAYISESLGSRPKAHSPAAVTGVQLGMALGHTEDLRKGVGKEGASAGGGPQGTGTGCPGSGPHLHPLQSFINTGAHSTRGTLLGRESDSDGRFSLCPGEAPSLAGKAKWETQRHRHDLGGEGGVGSGAVQW